LQSIEKHVKSIASIKNQLKSRTSIGNPQNSLKLLSLFENLLLPIGIHWIFF